MQGPWWKSQESFRCLTHRPNLEHVLWILSSDVNNYIVHFHASLEREKYDSHFLWLYCCCNYEHQNITRKFKSTLRVILRVILTKYCVIILFTIALLFYSHLKQLSCYKNSNTLHICQFRFPSHSRHIPTSTLLTLSQSSTGINPAHLKRNSTVAFRKTASISIYFRF